jgi:formyl-CoA transferase
MPLPPLHAIRVLDLSRFVAGPVCAMQLADLGAEVIKIEDPKRGDDSRHLSPPEIGGEAYYYLSFNRNKRSLAMDIRTPEGQAVMHDLLAVSDVLVENFRSDVLPRYGLDYESIKARYPTLIYCSISGYGRTGPLANRGGIDTILQAESGFMAFNGEAEGRPLRHPLALVDSCTGMYATQSILGALYARRDTGEGQFIDMALLDSSFAMMSHIAQYYLTGGEDPPRAGNQHPSVAPSDMFEAPGGQFYLAVTNDRLFERLCRDVLGRPDLLEDPRYSKNPARASNREALSVLLGDIFATRERADWLADFDRAGIPAGAVRQVSEAAESPEIADRNMVATVDHPTAGRLRLVASPHKLAGTPPPAPTPPPLLGEHDEEILSGLLGYDDARLRALRDSGTIRKI